MGVWGRALSVGGDGGSSYSGKRSLEPGASSWNQSGGGLNIVNGRYDIPKN